ncbi:HD domain-containing protein [Arthrobacter sp. KK5.5]|uniref:HD domain-containing protein n=1 Tax=Arthrobacter sp. KK5.5 TaxID=3373084 RepID=UPI003EE7A610
MRPEETDPQVAAARAVATIAHRGQTDHAGADYISHPARVAGRLTAPAEVAAAWLHDTIEDCGIGADELLRAGIAEDVVTAVVLLTRTPEMGSDDYYRAIRANPVALAVKLADIADNTDPERVRVLRAGDPVKAERLAGKYRHALEILGG